MCGRFTLTAESDVVASVFELGEVPTLSPRYNIAPTQPVLAVLADPHQQERFPQTLRWGLIPSWAKDPGVGARMINARAESVATKPAFRSAQRHRRCLIPADGFYEWQKVAGEKRKQPFYVCMDDGRPFAFAGLWEHWEGPDGSAIQSCTVITTEPNELMRPLHDRMPVILPRQDYDRWLNPSARDPASLETLLVPHPAENMKVFAVSTYVNAPSRDTPQCIEPLGRLF